MNEKTQNHLWLALQALEHNHDAIFSHHPNDETLRLQNLPNYAYPINNNDKKVSSNTVTLSTNSTGLLQQASALPDHYQDLISSQLQKKHSTLLDFINLFNHRWLILHYQAWKKSRIHLSEKATESSYSRILSSLIGGASLPKSPLACQPQYYAGLLIHQVKTYAHLKILLEDAFNVPVAIHENIGQWLSIDPKEQTQLGQQQRKSLGIDTSLGARVWDCQYKIRITLGPMNLKEYKSFLPKQSRHQQIQLWLSRYLANSFCYDIQLTLKRKAVPKLTCTHSINHQLGYTTWLGKRPITHANELIMGEYYV